ncbi:MAG: replication initiation protein [Candidatus Amoebophilus sp.]
MVKKLIRQHNAITEARYEMTPLEKNIFYMLLAEIKESDPVSKIYYKISFLELEERIEKKLDIPTLMKAVRSLIFRIYTIEEENGDILNCQLITSAENFPEEEHAIELGVSPDVRPYLLSLKKDHTEFELDIALNLKSKYSKRIYEMICKHKKDGKFVISVEDLKYRFCLLDRKTGEDKYPGWHMFAKHVLEIPQKELNERADLTFNYTPKKTGKKFTHIDFTIIANPKKQIKYEGGLFGNEG